MLMRQKGGGILHIWLCQQCSRPCFAITSADAASIIRMLALSCLFSCGFGTKLTVKQKIVEVIYITLFWSLLQPWWSCSFPSCPLSIRPGFRLESIGHKCVQPGVRLLAWVLPMCGVNCLFLFILKCSKKKHNKNIQNAFLEVLPFS